MREMIVMLTGAMLCGISLPGVRGEHPSAHPAVGALRLLDTTMTITPASATLGVGQQLQFQATVRSAGSAIPWPTANLRWVIRNQAVATDNGRGLVTAVAPGSTVLWVTTTTAPVVSDSAFITVGSTTAPRVSLSIRPPADTLVVNDTLWLHAVVKDSLGSVLTGQPVVWSTARPSVVTLSGNGDSVRLRAGPNLANALIRATLPELSDSAWITVLSLSVLPMQVTAGIGNQLPFTAEVRDSAGNQTSRQLFWSSADPATAEIIADAGVTAKALTKRGGVTSVIVATRRGGSATAKVTVVDTTTLAGECAEPKAEWLWCDDFQADRLASYFEYDNANFRFLRDSTAGRNNSFGMRARFLDGRRTAGALKVAVGRAPVGIRAVDTSRVVRRELYWRVFVQHDSGWTANGGARLTQGTSLVNRRGAQAMAAYVWSGDARPRFLAADPASGTDEAGNVRTTRYDDFANLRWLGPVYSRTAVLDSSRVGQWQCVEASARLNTAGQSDGRFRLWVNDSLEADSSGFNWVGGYRDYGLNAVIIENVLGRPAGQAQERRYDNLVVSTARIGCAAGSR